MRIRYALVCLLVLGGCGRPAPTSSSTTPAADRSDSSLGRVADSLRKATDVDACRSSIQQINSHLFNHPDPKLLLSDKEKAEYGVSASSDRDGQRGSGGPGGE